MSSTCLGVKWLFSWPAAVIYASPISVTVDPLEGCDDEGNEQTVVTDLSYFREQHLFVIGKGTLGPQFVHGGRS